MGPGERPASAPEANFDAHVATRLEALRQRIAAAGGSGVEVLAVTKTWPIAAAFAAHRAGCRAIGESYAQEVVAKLGAVERPFAVHFIGRLQSNKVRHLAGIVDVFESVDRTSLADEIARRAPGASILVQVNTTGETDKGGCPVAETGALVDHARGAGLVVRGLMTVGPTEGGPAVARPGFRAVRALVSELGLEVCSMGMTDDLEVAVEEGSTEVRIGSALFGPRRAR